MNLKRLIYIICLKTAYTKNLKLNWCKLFTFIILLETDYKMD